MRVSLGACQRVSESVASHHSVLTRCLCWQDNPICHGTTSIANGTAPPTLLLLVLLQVIKLISRVIADFANGEISQAGSLFDTEVTLEQYLEKSFYKTASLVAASCRSSAVFSLMDEDHKDAMYAYGKHLGLAFQVGVG
jgi:geranylgeranyl pyrophosphate synthase